MRTEVGSTVSETLKPEFLEFRLKDVETRMKRDKKFQKEIAVLKGYFIIE